MNRQLLLVIALTAGCRGTPPDADPGRTVESVLSSNAIISNAIISNAIISNAIISNAIISNALSSNALSSNALSSNALSSNALRADGFTEGELARQFLSYVYSCAMPLEASMRLELNGHDYGTLTGGVGLAPEWGREGGRCDEHCQRWVTACLLARTNFWGVPVKLSLRGNHPALTPSADEKRRYPLREGAYYGNLFTSDGIQHLYACSGPGSNVPQLTSRFCSGAQGVCAIQVGFDCINPLPRPLPPPLDPEFEVPTRFACARMDPDDGAMLDCYTGGISIQGDDPAGKRFAEAITVYLAEPLAICGDGVCTGSETPDSCATDCSKGWAWNAGQLLDVPGGLARMPGGDIVVWLQALGSVDLGGGPIDALPGELSMVLARLDARGRHVWSRQVAYGLPSRLAIVDDILDTQPNRLLVNGDGDIFVTGYIADSAWLEDARLLFPPDPAFPEWGGFFVGRFSPTGERRWLKPMRGLAQGFYLGKDGGPVTLALVPTAAGPAGWSAHMALVHFSRDGEVVTTELPFFDPAARLLATDGDGRLLLVLSGQPVLARVDPASGGVDTLEVPPQTREVEAAAVTGDGGVVTVVDREGGGDSIPLLVRHRADGSIAWSKQLATPLGDAPIEAVVRSVDVNGRGEIMVVGHFEAPMVMENQVLSPAGFGAVGIGRREILHDVWVAKYASDGRQLWVKSLGSGGLDAPMFARLEADGTVLTTGVFSQTGVFDGRILVSPAGGGLPSTLDTFLVSIPDPVRE